MRLPERLAHILGLEPDAPAIESEGRWYPWRFLSGLAQQLDRALTAAGIPQGEAVGIYASNRPTVVAALAGLLMSRRCAVFINPNEPESQTAQEIESLRLRAFAADASAWRAGSLVDALRNTKTLGLVLNRDACSVSLYPGLDRPEPGSYRPPHPGLALDQTTSGTTGAPKRATKTLEQLEVLLAGGHPDHKNAALPAGIKGSPSIVFKSMAHSGGALSIMLALYEARPLSLHEKFEVKTWVEAVRRHRPKVASLVPAMVRMLWDAGVPPDALDSLIAIRTGTAPLDPLLQRDFEQKYGIPLLIDYGGTEIGAITAWSLIDHKQYAQSKRGSAGRVKRGVDLRTVDETSGAPTAAGAIGILEVRNSSIGPEWIRTTDLAAIDADGFLFVHGRVDGAINRGGFKILPEIVAQALRSHEDVGDAAVIGVADQRLGQVPVAFVEPHPGRPAPEANTLIRFARDILPAYQVPVAIHVLGALPRTASLKVSLPSLRALLESQVDTRQE